MLFLLLPAALAAPPAGCGAVSDRAQLGSSIVAADESFAQLDEPGFRSAVAKLEATLPCVGQALDPSTVAGVHRAQALEAFLDRDSDRMTLALAGMLAANSGYMFPTAVVPEGHPIRGALVTAARLVRDARVRPLGNARGGRYEVDTARTGSAPVARAAVVQSFDGGGQVVRTAYLWPEDPVTGWDIGVQERTQATRASKGRVPLIAATASCAVLAGAAHAVAGTRHEAFNDTSVDRTERELRALQTTVNTLEGAAIVAASATAGLGLALVLTW